MLTVKRKAEIVSLNLTAVVLAGVLVMLMQAGFGLVATGLCRAKNAAQIISLNLLIYILGVLGFWACGFALLSGVWPGTSAAPSGQWSVHLFGHPFGLLGTRGFFLASSGSEPGVYALFFFQAAVISLAAIIPAGVMAERWKSASGALYGLLAAAVPLAVFGHWVWGGGWLAQLGQNLGLGHGFVDFGGSSVVHLGGGIIGLMGATALGPRVGKYARDGRPRPIAGHNLVYVVAGSLLLAAGWFGLNIGPALFVAESRVPLIAVNTLLAAVAGAGTAYLVVTTKFRKPDPSLICNGFLAGLAAISAACPFVHPTGAVIIGAVAGFLAVHAVLFFEGTMKVDDPIGALSVHGVGGAWGVLSVGLLADGSFGAGWNGVATAAGDGAPTGVTGALATFFGGRYNSLGQLGAQCMGAASGLIFLGLAAWIWFKVSGFITPLRPRYEEEIGGLDLPELGAECYPDFHLTDKGATHGD
jgi:Amt family ammonium transporter